MLDFSWQFSRIRPSSLFKTLSTIYIYIHTILTYIHFLHIYCNVYCLYIYTISIYMYIFYIHTTLFTYRCTLSTCVPDLKRVPDNKNAFLIVQVISVCSFNKSFNVFKNMFYVFFFSEQWECS